MRTPFPIFWIIHMKTYCICMPTTPVLWSISVCCLISMSSPPLTGHLCFLCLSVSDLSSSTLTVSKHIQPAKDLYLLTFKTPSLSSLVSHKQRNIHFSSLSNLSFPPSAAVNFHQHLNREKGLDGITIWCHQFIYLKTVNLPKIERWRLTLKVKEFHGWRTIKNVWIILLVRVEIAAGSLQTDYRFVDCSSFHEMKSWSPITDAQNQNTGALWWGKEIEILGSQEPHTFLLYLNEKKQKTFISC